MILINKMISKIENSSPRRNQLSCHDLSEIYGNSLVLPDGEDINLEQKLETKQTYIDSALLYSAIEWSTKLTYKTWSETRKPFIRELLKQNIEDKKILFAGCGTGRDMKRIGNFLRRIGKSTQIFGIDYSSPMVEIAKTNLGEDAQLEVLDLTNLDKIIDESFGSIFCESALTHLSKNDMYQVLADFHRILAPNGIAFIGFRDMENNGLSNVYTTTNDLGNRHYLRMNKHQQEEALIGAGFSIVWNDTSSHIDQKRPSFTNYIVNK